MKIETNNGSTFEVEWMWGPVRTTGNVMLEMKDDRPLSQIAADLEGCETIKQEEAKGAYRVYEGYTDLRSISRNDRTQMVQVTLAKP